MHQLSRISAIGTNFAIAVIGMGLLGFGADYLFKTKPICTLVGIGLGLFGGAYRFVKEANAANRSAARSSSRTDGKPGADGRLYRKIEEPEEDEEDGSKPQ